MKKTSVIITIFFIFFNILIPKIIFAQSKILINEFLIEPQPQQVEIINIGSESADISGWIIDDDGGSSSVFIIPPMSIIYPNSCLIFSDNFYFNVKSSDKIRLFDNQNNLIDSFSYKSSPGSGISYQKIPDGENNWSTRSATLGLFNYSLLSCLTNFSPIPFQSPTPTPLTTPSNTPIPSPTGNEVLISPTVNQISITYDNIFLSEAMVNPQTGEKEWVEIYNNNDFDVFLNQWYLDDVENAGSSLRSFNLNIKAKSFAIIELSSAIFNNDGDSVRLLDLNKQLKDSFEYQYSEKGKSWARNSFDDGLWCLQEPTKEENNKPCQNQEDSLTTTITNPILTITTEPKPSLSKQPFITKKIFLPAKNLIKIKTNYHLLNNDAGEILGITTQKDQENELLTIKTLSHISLNYLFFSLTTLTYRLKKRLIKK